MFSGGETAGLSSQPNPTLAATVTPGNGYEIQDWTVTWDVISDLLWAHPIQNRRASSYGRLCCQRLIY